MQSPYAEYVCRLETLLLLYALTMDEQYPLVCFDERPCFLIGNVVEGLCPKPGQLVKEHYAYSKHVSCVVMGAVAPHLGQRLMAVYEQRTKKEYTLFMQQVAEAYPKAVKIRLVQDKGAGPRVEHAYTERFLRVFARRESGCFGGSFRVLLYPKVRFVVEHDRIGVLGFVSTVSQPAYSDAARIGKRGVGVGGKPESSGRKDQVAVHG